MMLWLGNRSKEETLDRILSIGLLDGVIVTAHIPRRPARRRAARVVPADGPRRPPARRPRPRATSTSTTSSAADVMIAHLVQIGPAPRSATSPASRGTVAAEDRLDGLPPGDGPRRALDRRPRRRRRLQPGVRRGRRRRAARRAASTRSSAPTTRRPPGALETIRARGLRVPDDVALAGFDDLDFAAHLDPPLTTVRQGVARAGRRGGPRRCSSSSGIPMAAPAA